MSESIAWQRSSVLEWQLGSRFGVSQWEDTFAMNPAVVEPVPTASTLVAPLAIPPEFLPDHENIVTEDDTPVDNVFSEKQQRILTEPLYSSWPGPGEGRPFLALANVGLFSSIRQPPVVPDAMLSLDVRAADDLWKKENRSYFIWIFGKTPEVVIEVVSNRDGGEDSDKLALYARIGIPYYVIYDPEKHLGANVFRAFKLDVRHYAPLADASWMPEVGLGLKLWEGKYEDCHATWLRWCDRDGNVIPTGRERADDTQERLEQTKERLEQTKERLEQTKERLDEAERQLAQEQLLRRQLEAKLKQLGIDRDV
jgi:Uma2 family endonuclease